MKERFVSSRTKGNPGDWARKVAPPWTFTLYDASERLGLSLRRTIDLIGKYHIPTGLVFRIVRLRDGSLRTRRIRILTPTALESLLLHHAGDQPRPARPEWKP